MNDQRSSSLAICSPDHALVRAQAPLVVAAFVIDCSHSMHKHGDAPLTGMRSFVTGLQNGPNPERIAGCIVNFADETTIVVPLQPITRVNPAYLQYNAAGFTRLYGSVHDTLYALLTLATHRETMGLRTDVILSVLTDGEDNRSRDWLTPCRRLAEEARRRGWEMSVFGLGVSGVNIAVTMGFSDGAGLGATGQPVGYDMRGTRDDITTTMTHTVRRTHITVIGSPVSQQAPDSPR